MKTADMLNAMPESRDREESQTSPEPHGQQQSPEQQVKFWQEQCAQTRNASNAWMTKCRMLESALRLIESISREGSDIKTVALTALSQFRP